MVIAFLSSCVGHLDRYRYKRKMKIDLRTLEKLALVITFRGNKYLHMIILRYIKLVISYIHGYIKLVNKIDR